MFASFSDRILLPRKPRAGLETHKIHQWKPEYIKIRFCRKIKRKKKSYEIKFACLTDFVIFKRQKISAPRTTKKLFGCFSTENFQVRKRLKFHFDFFLYFALDFQFEWANIFIYFFVSFNVLFEVNKQLSMLGCHFDGNMNKKKERKEN